MKTLTGMRVGGVVLGGVRIGGGVGDRVRSSRPTRWHMGLESREIEVRTWHRTEKPDVGICRCGAGPQGDDHDPHGQRRQRPGAKGEYRRLVYQEMTRRRRADRASLHG